MENKIYFNLSTTRTHSGWQNKICDIHESTRKRKRRGMYRSLDERNQEYKRQRIPWQDEGYCESPCSNLLFSVCFHQYERTIFPILAGLYSPPPSIPFRYVGVLYAALCHSDHTPISELTVPARPTRPSSIWVKPRVAAGTVKSHRSEMSRNWVAVRCLQADD